MIATEVVRDPMTRCTQFYFTDTTEAGFFISVPDWLAEEWGATRHPLSILHAVLAQVRRPRGPDSKTAAECVSRGWPWEC